MYFKKEIKQSDINYMKTYNVFRLGDIAFEGNKSKNYAFGRFVENDIGDGIVSHVFNVFRPIKKYDLYYWKHFINNEIFMRNILRKSTIKATMMNNLVTSDFLKQKVMFPIYEEQKQIGQFLKNIDYLITLQERKLELYKQLKKYLLQKMFANEQEKVPQIRFKGFYEDWKVNSLHKMVNIFDGVHQTPNYTDYGIKFLSVENIKTLNSTKYISKKDFKKDFKNPPQKGDIFMTRIGSVGVANIYKRRESVAYYVSLALIKPKSINSLFLFSSINTPQVQKEIWKRTLQVAFPKKINKEEIGKIKLKFPLLKEQFDIGGFFEKIDLQIKSIETTNIFHSIKQYFLQNLFC